LTGPDIYWRFSWSVPRKTSEFVPSSVSTPLARQRGGVATNRDGPDRKFPEQGRSNAHDATKL
jgi:hypothetical protein